MRSSAWTAFSANSRSHSRRCPRSRRCRASSTSGSSSTKRIRLLAMVRLVLGLPVVQALRGGIAAVCGRFERQPDDEGGPAPFLGFIGERAAVFFDDDRAREGQPLAGALADTLGGEERLKNMFAGCRRDAGSGILDPNLGP